MARTAKEFLNDFRQRLIENQPPIDFKNPQKGFPGWWEDDTVQEMMDAYASEVLRDELIKYTIWHQDKMFGCHALKEAIEHGVDEYLKTK